MSNTTLTADVIAAEAIMILDNELVMANKVHRAHENEFKTKVNGYEKGETISIRKPTDFTVRDGATMAVQDVTEGKTTLTIDKRKGIDFKFSSQDLTLKIGDLSERVIKPAMIQLANQVDSDIMALYKDIPSWVGTPGQTINAFSDFAKGPERMDEYANPMDGRAAVLCPADHWGLVGSQTALYSDTLIKPAYRSGSLGMVANVDTYMSQNVPTHTVGTWAGSTIAVDGSVTSSTITYSSVKDTDQQTITVDGFTASSPSVAVGDVFKITGVYAVNPVTKARLAFEKQFTVVSTANASGNQVDITFSPAMIWSGAFQSISTDLTDLDGAVVVPVGTDATSYRQNLMFTKNAFALAMVPLVSPPGAVQVARKSYKGLSVRVIPVYDGIDDVSAWRLDILYGVKTLDKRQAVRISGT